MTYLFDTNILVFYITSPEILSDFERRYQPFSDRNVAMLSIVSIGEMKSIAIRRGWGRKKMEKLDELFQSFLRIPINTEKQMSAYAEIDTYSLKKHPDHNWPQGYTSNKMGKNDLWIAATAYITRSTLVTHNGDFDHLNGKFFDVVKPELL